MSLSLHTIDHAPILCLPHRYFSHANLTDTSVYAETGLTTGPADPVLVSGNYDVSQTGDDITDRYDVILKIQDTGVINTHNSNTPNAGFIYRNTLGDSSISTDQWMGYANTHTVMDVHTVSQTAGSGTNQYLHPRATVDKDGRLYVVYKNDTRVGLNIRDTDGTWTEVRGSSTALVRASENNAPSNGSRTDADICYVEDTDRLYVFYPVWDAGDTKMSVGVKVSSDHGATWYTQVSSLVSTSDSSAPDDDTLFRIRSIYNPKMKTFTLTWLYDDGGTTDIRTVTLHSNFSISEWPDSTIQDISDVDTYDLTMDPVTGVEYMFTYHDGTNTLKAYQKPPGKNIWTLITTSTDFSSTSNASTVGMAAFWHPDGQPAILMRQGAASTQILLYRNSQKITDSYFISKDSSYNLLGKVSGMLNISITRYKDSLYLLGNPDAVSTTNKYAIMMYEMGGWTNIPPVQTDEVLITPWDTPDDQTSIVTWTDATASGGSVATVYDTTLFQQQIKYSANSNTSSSAYSSATFTDGGVAPDYIDVQAKVRMYDANTSHTSSSRDGFGLIELECHVGTNRAVAFLKIAELGLQWFDDENGIDIGDFAGVFTTTGDVWIRAILEKSTLNLTSWYSLDGRIWEKFCEAATLAPTSDVSADYTKVKIGVEGASGIATDMRVTILKVDISDSVADAINYDSHTADPTDVIPYMPGCPLSFYPNYLINNAYVYASVGSCISGEYWSLKSESTNGLRNVLVDGNDSPRMKWTQNTTDGTATLIWAMPESISMNSGFVFFEGTGASIVTLKKGSTTGGDLTNISTFTVETLLGTNGWTRYSNTIIPTGSNSSAVWFNRNELAGSYLDMTGGEYRLITGNSEGYWSTGAGRKVMEIHFTGDTSGLPTNGTSLTYQPKKFVMFYNITNPHTTARNDDYQLQINVGGGAGYLDVSTIRVGTYHVLPCAVAPGYTKSIHANHERRYNAAGISQGYLRGPSARSIDLTVTDFVPASRYSSPSTNYISLDGTNYDADVSSGIDLLESVSGEYGNYLPIIFVDDVISIPANGTITMTSQSAIIFGAVSDSMRSSYDMPPGYDAVRTGGQFTITEVV